MVHDSVALMLEALTLKPGNEPDTFCAPSLRMPRARVYGGQVLAQSVLAASRCVDDDRPVHSVHAYFLRPGDDRESIDFAVDRIHDGRSFSTRRAQAYQKGQPILSMIASFQDRDSGFDHQMDMPTDIPGPGELPSAAEELASIDHPMAEYWANYRPFDIRHVGGSMYDYVHGDHVARQAVWMRTQSPLPDDPALHRAALAWASDYTIFEPAFRRHGIAWATDGLKAASLDHAMWFHRDGRADEWMLYVLESPSAQGGRSLGTGRIYAQDGTLIATVAQEGMMRVAGER